MIRQRLSFALLAAVLCSASCSRPHSSSKELPSPLRVAIDQFVGFAPVFVASEEHFFSQRGLTVEALPILDTAQRTTAFASGRVDAICTTLDSLLLTGTKGVDLVIVFAVDESKGADGILTSPSIRKPTDLKGKRVAFQEAMPSHFLLLWYLNANGMNADDVQRINMNADDAGAAFIAGKVDAAVTWEPWLSRAKEAGKGRLLTSTADLPGVLVDVLAVRRAVLVNRPEAVQALYAGWMDAIDFYNKSPDVAVSVMSKNLKLDEKEVRLNASTLLFADRSFNNQFFKRDAKDSAWTLAAQAVKIWQGAGLMPAGQNSDQFISDQIVKGPVRK